jgi:hypothetical protein
VLGEWTDHEHHHRDSGYQGQCQHSTDSSGVLQPDAPWKPLLAEGAEPRRQPWIISGEIPFHLVKDALLIHR